MARRVCGEAAKAIVLSAPRRSWSSAAQIVADSAVSDSRRFGLPIMREFAGS